jgi:hypothetical protein
MTLRSVPACDQPPFWRPIRSQPMRRPAPADQPRTTLHDHCERGQGRGEREAMPGNSASSGSDLGRSHRRMPRRHQLRTPQPSGAREPCGGLSARTHMPARQGRALRAQPPAFIHAHVPSRLPRAPPTVTPADGKPVTESNLGPRAPRAKSRLIETPARRCGFAVAFERSDGLAPEPPADRVSNVGLALDRGACPSVLAVAWLERGASASRSGIRHARHGCWVSG